MKCRRYQGWIKDKALGVLDARREGELQAHLAVCAECRGALEHERLLLATIDRGVAQAVVGEPSAAMAARVRQRVAAEAGAADHARRLGFRRWVTVAVAGGLIIAIGSFWLAHRQSASRVTVPNRIAGNKTPAVAQPVHTASGEARHNDADRGMRRRLNADLVNDLVARARRDSSEDHARRAPAEPEVIVEKGQAALVLQLYNAALTGRVDGASLVAIPPGLKRDADGLLMPLEIPPLPTQETDESGADESGGGHRESSAIMTTDGSASRP